MHDLNGWDPRMHFKNRRDTIAFMPQSIEALKFADDIDFEEASHRSVIRNEDDSLLLTEQYISRVERNMGVMMEIPIKPNRFFTAKILRLNLVKIFFL